MRETSRVLILLVTLVGASVLTSGCLNATAEVPRPPAAWADDAGPDRDCDGVPDAEDALVRAACAAPSPRARTERVTFAFAVVTRAPSADAASTRALTDLAPQLVDAFTAATGGRVTGVLATPPVSLPVETGRALSTVPWDVTRAFFASPDAPRDVDVLVLVAGNGVALADSACACSAWHERARNAGALGAPFDLTHALHVPVPLLGVTGYAHAAELLTLDEDALTHRFLHETAHAWCCRLDASHPLAASLLAASGAHWNPAHPAFRADPVAGHEPMTRPEDGWAFSAFTLVAIGAVPAEDAPPVRAGAGTWLSASDVLSLSRAPPGRGLDTA